MTDLHDLVAARSGELGSLAASWLTEGAKAVELWSPTGLAARWAPGLELGRRTPSDQRGGPAARRRHGAPTRFPRSGGTHVPITNMDEAIGWLRLVGLSGAVARRRLLADASMIGGLVAHERDLAAMTQALVESQDDLLGLVSMLGAARVDDGDLRTSLAHRARELMRSEGVAIVTPGDGGWRVDGSPQEAAHEAGSLIATASSLEEVGRALSAEWLVFDAPEHLDVPMLLAVRRSLSGPPTSPLMRLAASTAELCAALIGQAERHAEALERQRLARQLEFAGEVQRHLLQRTSARARGLRLATSYQPADAVGGDLYAVRNHGDETVLALGDVSGKGAPAALLMAAARALFESHSRTTTDPRELLALVARDLDEDLDRNGALLTFVIARYRASSGALSVANAGHAPVLLKTAAGVSLLEPTDPPLGVVSGGHFGQLELDLCAGDTLLLASDGLSEREAPDGRFFGIDRISRLVERSDGTPRRLVDGIRAAARRFAAGRPAADDETLVVVQARRGASA